MLLRWEHAPALCQTALWQRSLAWRQQRQHALSPDRCASCIADVTGEGAHPGPGTLAAKAKRAVRLCERSSLEAMTVPVQLVIRIVGSYELWHLNLQVQSAFRDTTALA